MTILWEFDEKPPKQLSAYGVASWATLSRSSGTQFGEASADSLAPFKAVFVPAQCVFANG